MISNGLLCRDWWVIRGLNYYKQSLLSLFHFITILRSKLITDDFVGLVAVSKESAVQAIFWVSVEPEDVKRLARLFSWFWRLKSRITSEKFPACCQVKRETSDEFLTSFSPSYQLTDSVFSEDWAISESTCVRSTLLSNRSWYITLLDWLGPPRGLPVLGYLPFLQDPIYHFIYPMQKWSVYTVVGIPYNTDLASV